MSEKYKIERGISPPSPNRVGPGKPARYPWRELKVGESFLIPCTTPAEHSYYASQVLQSARSAKWDGKLTTRSGPNGVRVWRIK